MKFYKMQRAGNTQLPALILFQKERIYYAFSI